MATNLLAKVIVCAYVPFSVPTSCADCFFHLLAKLFCPLCLCFVSHDAAHCCVVRRYVDEHLCNHYGFSVLAFLVGTSLERVVGVLAKAVKVKAVVPVCASDERKSVRSHVVGDVVV